MKAIVEILAVLLCVLAKFNPSAPSCKMAKEERAVVFIPIFILPPTSLTLLLILNYGVQSILQTYGKFFKFFFFFQVFLSTEVQLGCIPLLLYLGNYS